MKNLEKDKLQTLLQIIGETPSLHIAHFSDGGDTIIDMLKAYCQKREYHYYLLCTNGNFYEKIAQRFQEDKGIVIRNFPLQRRTYLIQALEYNFLFVTAYIEEENRASFLEKSHKIIRTAGNIVLFILKKDYQERDSWRALLEEQLYVSTSVIDDLFEHYDVIISRKMHGWGK